MPTLMPRDFPSGEQQGEGVLASIWTAVWGWKDLNVNTGGEGQEALMAHWNMYKAMCPTNSQSGLVPADDAN